MIRRTPVLATTAVLATVALSACGGSDTKAAPNPTTTVSVATTSATATTPVATTSNSAVAAAPSTSGTQAATSPVATATVTRTASSARPTATATVTRGAVSTKAASTEAGGCRTSDGTLLNLDGVSCGFAQNGYAVFKANRDYLMRAYSPTAHQYYTFTCSEDGLHIVACGGGTMNPNSLFSWQD